MAPVFVCVPARNEAERLPELFAALAAQTAAAGPWSLCLLLDSCVDASRLVACRLRRRAGFPVAIRSVATAAPNAGRARAAALRMAQRRAGEGPALFLCTDADSAPASDWIACARASLATCDLVTGRIARGPGSPLQDRIERYYDRLYVLRRRLDPVAWEPGPHHHFTGGANMAFRSEAYRSLGGFAPRACGEDALMVDEAQRAGLRVRRDASLMVRTSSRRIGRAPGGLAAQLRTGQGAEGILVAHPQAMAWQYAAHAHARTAFAHLTSAACAALARRLALAPEDVRATAVASPNAESFAIRIVPAPPDGRIVPLPAAEQALSAVERASALEQAA